MASQNYSFQICPAALDNGYVSRPLVVSSMADSQTCTTGAAPARVSHRGLLLLKLYTNCKCKLVCLTMLPNFERY